MQHPDFELYDNVGCDADQIAAARYGIATRNDLLRWAKRDAEPFLAQHPLPEQNLPSLDLGPYLDALAAARWRGQNRSAELGSPPKMLMTAASRSLSVLAIADQADLAILRAAYDPAPTQAVLPQSRTAPGLPPAPPGTPSAGPAPGR